MRFARFLSRTTVAGLAALALAGTEVAAAQAPATAKDKTETPAAPATAAAARRGPRPGDVQKVFVINHVNADRLAQILSVFPAEISASQMGFGNVAALAVSASPAVLSAIEETVKRLDVPTPAKRNVEVTAQVLECSMQAGDAGSTPTDLQDVVGQLKRTFSYTGCSLVQTLLARGREGSIVNASSPPYRLRSRADIVASDGASIVKLSPLSVGHEVMVKLPGGGSNARSNTFEGDIDVRNGQRALVGKLGTGESGKDEILVVTAKILD